MIKSNCKKQYMLKNMVFILTLLIVTGVFTACGKADREDIERDLSENVTYSATGSDAEYVTDEDIPEKLSYTVNGTQGTIKVNADVYADGYGNIPTYNIKKIERNDAWLDGYAKKFFDGGQYENIKPYRFCSLDELRQEKSFCEELLSQYEAADPAYGIIMKEKADIELQIENYVEAEYVKYPDDKLIYEFDIDFGLQSGKIFNCERAHLKGEADGKLWYLNYERGFFDGIAEEDYEEYYEEYGAYTEQQGLLHGFCPENTPNLMYMMNMDTGFENKCERETAEKEAEKLLEGLGFGNMKQVNITSLRINPDENDDGSCMLDGYILTYAPSVNGIDLLYGSNNKYISVDNSNTEEATNILAGQPFVKIAVSSDGIFEFGIYEQYEIGDILAGSSSMLSFEQVDSQVKGFFESLADNNNVDVEIDEIRFGYACITYDGISYAMVPVWRYYTLNVGGAMKHSFITVCALDGSYLSGMDSFDGSNLLD